MNTSSNADPTSASATSPIPADPIHLDRPDDVELDRKHHVWCDSSHPLTADAACSTRGTNLTNATYLDDGRVNERGKGWAGWLAAGVDEDLVNLVLEGKPEWAGDDFGIIDLEIPVWQVNALLEVFEDDRGREALRGLLARMREAR